MWTANRWIRLTGEYQKKKKKNCPQLNALICSHWSFLKGFRFGALKIESADHVFALANTKAFSHLHYALVPVEVRCKTIMVIKALLVPTKKVLCGKNKYSKNKKNKNKKLSSRALLWGVQVWGPLRLVRGGQMVFVCDGEQRRCSGGSFHRSALVSLFHLQALGSYKHPQSTALWCFDHCVYSEKSGKYVNFKTKGTAMHNGPRSWTNKLDWKNLAEMLFFLI